MKKFRFYIRIVGILALIVFMVSNFTGRSLVTNFTDWHNRGFLYVALILFFVLVTIEFAYFLYNGFVITTIIEEEENE